MPELQLNPKKTALVLIDLQNSTVDVDTAPYTAVQVIANSKKLAETFRGAGAPASSPPHARALASASPLCSSKTLAQAWTPKSIVLRFEKIFPRLARIRASDEVIAALV